MKFFVVVNESYLVLIDEDTLTDAKHFVKSNYIFGISSYEAFDAKDAAEMLQKYPNLETKSLEFLSVFSMKNEICYHKARMAEHQTKAQKLQTCVDRMCEEARSRGYDE